MIYEACSFDEMCAEHDLKYIWECERCGHTHEEPPGYNEGGTCACGGEYRKVGESYI